MYLLASFFSFPAFTAKYCLSNTKCYQIQRAVHEFSLEGLQYIWKYAKKHLKYLKFLGCRLHQNLQNWRLSTSDPDALYQKDYHIKRNEKLFFYNLCYFSDNPPQHSEKIYWIISFQMMYGFLIDLFSDSILRTPSSQLEIHIWRKLQVEINVQICFKLL